MGLIEDLEKDFDTLLAEGLARIQNLDVDIDVSKGSPAYLHAAENASVQWGLRQDILKVYKNAFPDTGDTLSIERWAYLRGLQFKSIETPAELLDRVLNNIQKPPAGGNKNDYIQWALKVRNVKKAFSYPLVFGLGSMGVILLADIEATGGEIPSNHTDVGGENTSVITSKLVDSAATFIASEVTKGDKVTNDTSGTEARIVTVDSETELTLDKDVFTTTGLSYSVISLVSETKEYIESVCPALPDGNLYVAAPIIEEHDVTMTVTGSTANKGLIKADIEAYMSAMAPDEVLFVDQLKSIAVQNGADKANVTAPIADVTPAARQMIRPGAVSVT